MIGYEHTYIGRPDVAEVRRMIRNGEIDESESYVVEIPVNQRFIVQGSNLVEKVKEMVNEESYIEIAGPIREKAGVRS